MKFILGEQYHHIYLKKSELDESKMSEVQKRETKLAFYAGVSQAVLYYLSLSEFEEEELAIENLDNLLRQVTEFWASFEKRYDENN